jgi:hypothetical protein
MSFSIRQNANRRTGDGHFLERLPAGGFSLALDSTKPMNSATDTPKAGASLKMVLTLALFLPSSSNDM